MQLRIQCTELDGTALADGLGGGLEPAEYLQSALVSGGYNSGWCSIKSRAEMFVGFWHAPCFSNSSARSVAAFNSNRVADWRFAQSIADSRLAFASK